jgi:diacylglycerol kinase (ATP)
VRASVIFGLGTSPSTLDPFRKGSSTEWIEGVPASSSEADAILIFGGDGTIHRHLPALVRLGLPVLVVPAGSGNDFARALRLKSVRDSLRAWQEFESGKIQAQQIDLGVIMPGVAPEQKRYFCCVAGCGLDSATAKKANQLPRWLRSNGGYALALLPVLLKFPAFPMRLTSINSEGREESKHLTLLAAFANTQFYGGGMRIAPKANPTDGKLDVCQIHTLNPLELFCMFPTVYFGRHLLMPEVDYWKTEKIHVETEHPLEIYADGEFVCETPAEIGVAPKALSAITTHKLE